MTNTFNSGRILLDRMEWFNYLTTFQVDRVSQMTHWSLLHANQPAVPEATPAPGFERLMCLPQNVDQKITANKPAFEFPQKKSFLDDLCGFEGDEVDALFNGIQSDYPAFNLDPEKFEDPSQLPDPTVFDKLLDEAPNTPCPPSIMNLVPKEEVKSSAYGDSGYCSSTGSFPCSPPCSPSISEAGSSTSSTDEGIQSEISDLEYLDEFLVSMDRSVGSPKEDDKQTVNIKQESTLPAVPTIPLKSTGKRKRGPRPLVRYRGDGPTIQLWQFLLEMLLEPKCSKLIQWTQDEDYEFKILQPSTVATMWGKKKNKPTMNYEKLSRGIRYYYGNSVIEKVRGKRYVYRFLCDIPKIVGYDPMASKYEESMEESVCGEAVISPEDRDLLVAASSVEDGLLAVRSLDFSVLC